MRREAAVLRDACQDDPSCTTDPAADLAWLVRHGRIDGQRIDGTHLLDAMAVLSLSTVNPTFDGVPGMLNDARKGDTAVLAQFLVNVSPLGTAPTDLDAGLHMATLCGDLRFPWGNSSAPMAGRDRAIARAVARTPERTVWPYDLDTARRVLEISGCRAWPPTAPTRYAHGPLRAQTLILSGEHDLFCPLPWARRQLRHTPNGRLVVMPNGGHATQRAEDPTARDAVTTFLLPPA
jgi:pimeloyl-ACP methyl ester carboxylesterase